MGNITFDEWAFIWLEKMVRDRVKDNTYASYSNVVRNHLIPYFGGKNINDITLADVQCYLNGKSKTEYQDFLQKNKNCLSQMFDAAMYSDLCSKNPCVGVKMPRGKYNENDDDVDQRVYTEEEAELIFQYAYSHRFGAEIQTMLDTGMCRYEMLGLKFEDVDFENKKIYIRRGVADIVDSHTGKFKVEVGNPKNKYRKRLIPISTRLCEILDNVDRTVVVGRNEHKHRPGVVIPKQYIFCNTKGEVCSPRNWSRRHYDIFMKDMHEFYLKQGIDVPIYTPHRLRHTRASIWVNGGKSLNAVSKMLGHADLTMLQRRYAHSDADQLRELLDIS